MGFYRRFITTGSADHSQFDFPPSDNIVTPANALTAVRPTVLAPIVAKKLLRGERPVTPWVLVMIGSDMDGKVAFEMDRRVPHLRRGRTVLGAKIDPLADGAAILETSVSALAAPRVTPAAKVAIGGVLLQEGHKANWALGADADFRVLRKAILGHADPDMLDPEILEIIEPKHLSIPVDDEGKEAMVEKGIALITGMATNDFDSRLILRTLETTALLHAGVGIVRGEKARRKYADLWHDTKYELTSLVPVEAVTPDFYSALEANDNRGLLGRGMSHLARVTSAFTGDIFGRDPGFDPQQTLGDSNRPKIGV